MSTRIVRIAGSMLVIASFALVSSALLSSSPKRGPYESALASSAAGMAIAASSCNNKTCDFRLRKFTCVSAAGQNCQLFRGGSDCTPTTCS